MCALRLYTLATVVPVGASFLDPPRLNAFEGPSGAYCHVDIAVPVGVEALSGSRAFRSHSSTGMKNPFFGCIWRTWGKKKKQKKKQHLTVNKSTQLWRNRFCIQSLMHLGKLKDDRAAENSQCTTGSLQFCLTFTPLQHSPHLHFRIDKTEIQRYEGN